MVIVLTIKHKNAGQKNRGSFFCPAFLCLMVAGGRNKK
jgi:hypothetical protein